MVSPDRILAMQKAIEDRNLPRVRLLLKAGVPAEHYYHPSLGWSFAKLAARTGDYAIFCCLIDAGANIRASIGEAMIHEAVCSRNASTEIVAKVLAERYPDLLRQQVSCHAAHVRGDRVLPCGNCEKCRRIVGMLTAIDGDPRLCGYSDAQIARCLEALPSRALKQEAIGNAHLLWMLETKAAVPPGGPAREHPEILKLRFDPERSPWDAVR